jgi:hypothetical protein
MMVSFEANILFYALLSVPLSMTDRAPSSLVRGGLGAGLPETPPCHDHQEVISPGQIQNGLSASIFCLAARVKPADPASPEDPARRFVLVGL